MDSKPISIQNVNGNVTVTIVEGNNNKTELSVDAFTRRFDQDCGLRLIYNDYFKQDNNTSTNFKDWLNGFSFNIKSIYYGREFRRENLLKDIKAKLEEKQRLILLGESGTSKSVILIEIMCDYLKEGYKILHNLELGSMESSSSEIKNLEFIEDTLLALVKNGEKILVIVHNVHNKTIANIFSLLKNIRDDHEDKLDKIRFLLSARQPDFDLAMTGGGTFDSETKNRIDLLLDNTKREPISYFTPEEVKGFIEKYSDYWDSSLMNKSVDENAQVIFEDTKGHPIMVRFSVLKNGLKNHVRQMYQDWLLTKDDSPNIERIKSVIACSLYHISSIPLNDKTLSVDLNLEEPSYELDKTIIKIEGDIWTTIHPRWDLELFNYLFSLKAHVRKIQRAFSFILNKILDINSGTWNQVLILDTVYSTIAKNYVDIDLLLYFIKAEEIENKLDNDLKIIFLANIVGLTLSNLGRNEEAIKCYNKALQINPRDASAYYNKGNALSDLGRNEKAIDCYDRALEINPQHGGAYNNKGTVLSKLGRYEEALECFDKSIEIDPYDAYAYNNKGLALSALGRKEEAITCFDKAIEMAITWFDKAIEINPLYAHAYNKKGNILLDLGRIEEAITCFDKILEINPRYASAYYNKGLALLVLGRKEEAITCFDKILEINPRYASAYVGKGTVLSAVGRNEEAIEYYDKAIEIDPYDAYAYHNKGHTLFALGRYEGAIGCYNKTLEIDSQYADAYYNKGIALSALGRNEEAIVCYDRALEINPQNVDAFFYKGLVLSDLGRNEEAIASYDKALAIDPNYSDAINGKAFALAILGKNEEALPIIQKVLEIDPNNENYLSTAAFIMYNLKRYDESKIYYNKALVINLNLKDTLSESELKAFNSVIG
jgi:tetratricopeptide (TPR) repeat protein